MKKIVYGFLFLALVGIVTISCSNEEEQDLAVVNEVTFLDYNSKKINKSSNEISVEEFFNYVYFDGINSIDFMELNGVDINSFTDYVANKVEELNSKNVSNNSRTMKNPPSLEEIRDAMINECENGYCCGLDDACVIAVKIAYHIKKFQEDE